MSERKKTQNGQALLLVTLSLLSMCGIMGLAVDLGWSFYVKKSAQAAADSAALAAVRYAKHYATPPYTTCDGSTLYCSSVPVTCTAIQASAPSSDAGKACLYAQQNGFQDGTGRVKVTIAADATPSVPTAPNITVVYWVTVRVVQEVPQLFSAVLGNTTGVVAARATAAITNMAPLGGLGAALIE